MKNKQKGVLYARFSPRPKEKEKECESVERQIERLRKYAAENNIEVVGEFDDKALSGTDAVAERPGLRNALAALKRGYVLLIEAYSRLSRDEYQQKGLVIDLVDRGVRVVSATEESANGESDEAWLMRGMLALLDEYEVRRTRRRTSDRMRQHQANGRRMSDRLVYGWKAAPDRIIPLPNGTEIVQRMTEPDIDEQMVIQKMLKMHTEQGMGYREICRALADEGIACRGNGWYHSTIKTIIERGRANYSSMNYAHS